MLLRAALTGPATSSRSPPPAAVGLERSGEMASVQLNSRLLSEVVQAHGSALRQPFASQGRGMMQGLAFAIREGRSTAGAALRRGVLVECCGPHDEVLKNHGAAEH
ncbi:hypothetical protein RAD15_24390 [Bradyrhizobium sp. 14AA]